jgi:hypothetical protein
MIAGQRPFSGKSTAALLGAILRDEPRPLSEGRRGVPPELARIVAKALEKGRDDRYQHVQDLLADLRKLKRDLGPARTPLGPYASRLARPLDTSHPYGVNANTKTANIIF